MFTESYKPLRVQMMLALVFIIGALTVRPAQAWVGTPTGQSIQSLHYIVFERYADGRTSPVYYRLIEMAIPPRSLTNSEMNQALSHTSRSDEQIIVTLETSNGHIVYQHSIRISPWLRGEFHGATSDAPIDGHFIPLDITSFVVRVPQVKDTTLILKDARAEKVERFDLERLTIDTTHIQLSSSMEVENVNAASGPASNREDFLIMGDGYTSGQNAKFASDASAVASSFFSISPYSTYSNYYNVRTLFTASAQSGADHPPYNSSCGFYDPTCCGDPAMQSDPLQGTLVNTAFDSRFCSNRIHHLLVGSTSKILAAAAAVPEWDSILLIVNDTTYGGSGGFIPVISLSSSSAQIAQHEYGHSFVGLADEYDSPYPGYPTCSDISGNSPCEPNVTDVTNPLQIKWKAWINPNTPIPTPNDLNYQGIVGLFQGARYLPTGMYRPGYNCIMRTLGSPYCQVPSQAYVLRLYNGISLIEPNSLLPASPQIFLTHPATQTFHSDILSPVGGPQVQITWLENGVPIPNATGNNYIFTTSVNKSGLRNLTLRVKDITPLVIPAMAGNALQDEFTWAVSVDIPGVPSVVSSARANPSPTSAANVNFDVTFSEGVTGVDLTDYTLTTTGGISGVSITNITGSGNTYTVTVNTGRGNGTIRLDILDNDSIKDAANNPLGGANTGNGNFAGGETYTVEKSTNIDVYIGAELKGQYFLSQNESTRESYIGTNNGPVQITSTDGSNLISALRAIWKEPGSRFSYSEMMGLPKGQLSNEYWFPWYNNATPNSMDQGFRIANVDPDSDNTVEVWVGTTKLDTITLGAGVSTRVDYNMDNGPIKILCTTCTNTSNDKIIAALRVIWKEPGFRASYSEIMGLPKGQLSSEYWFPWYNNASINSMDQGFRIANVDIASNNTVEVWVGTTKLDTIVLAAGASIRKAYNVDNGPIKILCTTCTNTGNDKIIASLRVIWKEPGFRSSYSEMMGLPKAQLSNEYWFPWYNNATTSMDQGFRIANVNTASNNTVEVWTGSTKLQTISLAAGGSTRVDYNVDNGPVHILCTTCSNTVNDKIIAALRVIWKEPGYRSSYSEMMGLPAHALSTEYWFPWYNNADINSMDQGFRIAVP